MAYTAIDDPSVYFQTALYTGDGNSTKAITNDGNSDLQPDWVWTKVRSASNSHHLADTSRGITKQLTANNTNGEQTDASIHASVQSDGFTVGDAGSVNANGATYVSWQWKANGGSRTTNTESGNNPAGGYQANTTAGFSIVDYTGTGANGTMAHGLGVVPQVMIVKNRDQTDSWQVYHIDLGNNKSLFLDNSDPVYTLTDIWNQTTPTSSVFTIGTSHRTNADAEKYIAYCFTPIQGYSKFGSYTGNGSTTDGAFVYTGFSPAWVLMKRTSGSEAWMLVDSKRPGFNVIDDVLEPNDVAAEGASTDIDLLSNGFKLRKDNSNASGETYIYMAFAESPFVSSEGVPTTAR